MARPILRHPLLAALAAALILLLAALIFAGPFWHRAQQEIAFPIEARVQPTVPPVETGLPPIQPAAPSQAPPPASNLADPPVLSQETERQPAQPPTETTDVAAAPRRPAQTPPAAVADTRPAATPEAVQPTGQAPKQSDVTLPLSERQVLRSLPARLELNYTVRLGENGLALGKARQLWQADGGRYSLSSKAEASGVASLFAKTSAEQSSQGRIDAGGLKPEHYAQQRGEKRRYTSGFDWEAGRMKQSGPGGTVELPAGSQDLLSFSFHLAMTARQGEQPFILPVTDGRRLRAYIFRPIGRERLKLPWRELDTLHLHGRRQGEGSLDVWLAEEYGSLPVRIRTEDHKGQEIVLEAEEPPKAGG